jgi:hypothetical protein
MLLIRSRGRVERAGHGFAGNNIKEVTGILFP